MSSHVSDTWQAKGHNAWQRPMHVRHMEHGEGYIWGVGVVHTSREQQEGKGRKKKERERKEIKRGKEKRDRRRRKGEREEEKKSGVPTVEIHQTKK